MNPYIIFNGISSEDIGAGLIIEQLPDEMKPARNVEEIQILGRNGREYEDLGGYDEYTTNIKINCNGNDLSRIYAWLDGEGWMTTSQDPQYMRYVNFYGQFKDQRFRAGACYDTITVPVKVQPYKYLAEQTPIDLTAAKVFAGSGNQIAKPTLEITGNGAIALMVNGATVLIEGLAGTIILDCETETPYIQSGGEMQFAGRKITIEDDVWPYLEPGENSINWTGSISKIRVHPWWRWI